MTALTTRSAIATVGLLSGRSPCMSFQVTSLAHSKRIGATQRKRVRINAKP